MISSRSERGTILITTMVVIFMVAAFSMVLTTLSHNEARTSDYNAHYLRALSVAEGASEFAERRILVAMANDRPAPTEGDVTVGGITATYTITPLEPLDWLQVAEADGTWREIRAFGITATAVAGPGDAETSARARALSATAIVSKVIEVGRWNAFQFAVFYDRTLEIHPGPNMTLSGRVHSNRDIYVGSGATLNINMPYFKSAAGIYRYRLDENSTAGGTVNIRAADNVYRAMQGGNNPLDSSHPDWAAQSLNRWLGAVGSGAHGVGELAVPEIGSINMYEPHDNGDWRLDSTSGDFVYDPGNGDHRRGQYFANADLVIRDGRAYDRDGNDITGEFPAGTFTEGTMYDRRAGADVTLTNIDVAKVAAAGRWPSSGLLYAVRTDSSRATPNGVRLLNGNSLPDKLTVVTPNPLYVQGDFNNSGTRKPAAVIADSVNLLSNSWNDASKPSGSTTKPNASATTYNMSMVTGVAFDSIPRQHVSGSAKAYNGGFENLPRFHENWSNRKATISGSFVVLWQSEIGRPLPGQEAAWHTRHSQAYNAPIRDWDFDLNLNQVGNLPAFSPLVVGTRRVVWWEEGAGISLGRGSVQIPPGGGPPGGGPPGGGPPGGGPPGGG